jgi:pimeloyl-ACP methyl ester carboxylesterase
VTETLHSRDGTTIAYERSGEGPALLIIGGAFSNRHSGAAYVPLLAPHFTVYTYDRRGRGDSTDTPPYAVAREIEDLDALAAVAGGSLLVHGHSSGAVLALEATAAGLPVTRLSVYEPPYMVEGTRDRPTAEQAARVQAAVDAGRLDEAARIFLREAVGLPDDAIAMIEQSPGWAGMLAVAPTLPYDNAIVGDGSLPTDRLAGITVPTLVVAGGASPAWARASVAALAECLPNARHLTIEGQAHAVAPEVLVPVLTEFLLG